MTPSHRTLRETVREILREARDEAPPDAPLGRVAFAGDRSDLSSTDLDEMPEPDTEIEWELYGKLMRHFTHATHIGTSAANLIRDLLKRGWYSDVFRAPDVPEVFRGMYIERDWLIKAVGPQGASPKGAAQVSFAFEPKGSGSSWTTDEAVARKFGGFEGGDHREEYVAVLLHARVADHPGQLVVGPEGLYRVKGFAGIPEEREVLALGPIRVHRIEWGY
jgi:hypothetical protein